MTAFEIIFTAIFSPVLFWLCILSFRHGSKLVLIDTSVTALKEDVAELKTDMKISANKIDEKLNLFLKSEIDTLKEIAKSVKKEPE